ncbi:MAG: response regulator [Rickettsiales bacterium]|nr:response regulator [Rickettsiales bacterium]
MFLEVQEAEQSLLGYFDSLSTQSPTNQRCIRLQLNADEQESMHQQPVFIDAAINILQSHDVQCYFCKDGDTYIIAPTINLHLFHVLSEQLGYLFGSSLKERSFLYDLAKDIASLKALIEGKTNDRQTHNEINNHDSEDQNEQKAEDKILEFKVEPDTLRTMKSIRLYRNRPEILIIKDDQFTSHMIKKSLSGTLPVSIAYNGISALEHYFTYAPDIVFMDSELPDISGHELLQTLCSHDKDAFIVMLCGDKDKKNAMKFIAHGAEGFIGKPFAREKLIAYIQKYQDHLKL